MNLRPKALFSGGLDILCLERERWKDEDDDRCGRLTTTATPENVSRVEVLIKKDPKMTYTEIRDIMKISLGSLTRIFHGCLGVRKRCARCVPRKLNEELRKFDGGWFPRVGTS